MYNVSKLVALILAFTLGISVGAGLFAGAIAIALTSFTVRDIEKSGIPIPDEAIIGENPEVDILDLTQWNFSRRCRPSALTAMSSLLIS